MKEYFQVPESIECVKAEIFARKFANGTLIKDEKLGRCIKYTCSRNGKATILKELEPKKALKKGSSHLNLGDSIHAERFNVLIKGIRRLKFNKIGGHTGRHKTQQAKTSSYTFAEISKSFVNVINSIEKRQNEKINE